jgi:hypothetical protein
VSFVEAVKRLIDVPTLRPGRTHQES